MQFYKDNKVIKAISTVKNHHYNKRRLKKARNKNDLLMLDSNRSDELDECFKQHHVPMNNFTGGYSGHTSKHQSEMDFATIRDSKKSKHDSEALGKDLEYIDQKSAWIDSIIMTLKACILTLRQIDNITPVNVYKLEYVARNLVFHFKSKKAREKVNQFISQIKPFKSTDNAIDFIKNFLFARLDTNLITTGKNGTPLKYWKFQLLDYKHPFEITSKSFSADYDENYGWIGKNIVTSLMKGNLYSIEAGNQWLPNTNKPIIYLLWGNYGAHMHKAQKYLENKYNVEPKGLKYALRARKSVRQSVSVITHNLSDAKRICQRNPNLVIPIKFIRRRQKTMARYLLKHQSKQLTYPKIKAMVKFNKAQNFGPDRMLEGEENYIQVLENSILVTSPQPKYIQNILDKVVHNEYTLTPSNYAYSFRAEYHVYPQELLLMSYDEYKLDKAHKKQEHENKKKNHKKSKAKTTKK